MLALIAFGAEIVGIALIGIGNYAQRLWIVMLGSVLGILGALAILIMVLLRT